MQLINWGNYTVTGGLGGSVQHHNAENILQTQKLTQISQTIQLSGGSLYLFAGVQSSAWGINVFGCFTKLLIDEALCCEPAMVPQFIGGRRWGGWGGCRGLQVHVR